MRDEDRNGWKERERVKGGATISTSFWEIRRYRFALAIISGKLAPSGPFRFDARRLFGRGEDVIR